MSLLVWLPLLGNLNNQGISNLQFTNENTTNITTDTNGKIGSCYKKATVATAGRIVSDNTILLDGDLSMCCWAKVTATKQDTAQGLITNHSIDTKSGFSINVKQISTDDYRICCSTGNGSARTYYDYYGTTNIKNGWHHLALTYNNTTHVFQLWVDGIVEKTQSYTNKAVANKFMVFAWAVDNSTTTYYPACMLNDVRVYNHCLSAAEVHEISQGLVLHYKLDNQYNLSSSMQNKYNHPYSDGQSSGGSFTRTALDNERGYNYKYSITGDGTSRWPSWTVPAFTFTVGKRYFYSVKTRCNKWTAGALYLRAARSANDWVTNTVAICSSTLADGQWHEYYVSQVVNETYDRSGTTVTCSPRIEFYTSNLNGNGTVYDFDFDVKDVQVVESDNYIPFIDNSLANNIIQDSSGYGYNGTISDVMKLSSDTPRYSASTTSTAATTIGNNTSTIPKALTSINQYTMCAWLKTTGTTNRWIYQIGTGTGGCRGLWVTTNGSKPHFAYSGSGAFTATTTINDGKWHHICFTVNGSVSICYVDGTACGSSTSTKTDAAGSNNIILTFNGSDSLSDFRLYATTLSEDAIKQLYNMEAKIDNRHNIHSYELVESGENKITKQGQLKGSNIHEIPDLFAYDPIIYIEPDGTQWAHIFHHNNPTSYKFASTDTFNSFVHTDDNRWFNFAPCNSLPTYEFFAAVKKTSDAAITKYRWIQSASPLTATFDSTKSANVTKITTTGYTSCTFGGLYHVSGSTWLAMNNGTNNNWFGAVGCWTAWNGGITGWASTASSNAITTGSVDIYVRIDNIDFSKINLITKSIKTNKWQANNFIEL